MILHILAANYTGKHVTFNKGQCIGHIEPSTNHMLQTAINNLTSQKMLHKHVKLTLSHLPYIPSRENTQSITKEDHNLYMKRQVLAPFISLKLKLTWLTQTCLTEAIPHHYEAL